MVNIDSMTKKELVAFIKSGGVLQYADAQPIAELEESQPLPVEVADGFKITVDPDRLQSWKAASLSAKLQDSRLSDGEKLPYIVEFVEFAFGDCFDEILEHLGGADVATVPQVVALLAEAIEAAGAKN